MHMCPGLLICLISFQLNWDECECKEARGILSLIPTLYQHSLTDSFSPDTNSNLFSNILPALDSSMVTLFRVCFRTEGGVA